MHRPRLLPHFAIAVVVLAVTVGMGCRGGIDWEFRPMHLSQLAAAYPLVIEGVVTDANAQVNGDVDRDRRDYTLYEVEVVDVLKGDAGSEPVLVTVPDGSRVRLELGRPYLLFLDHPVPDSEAWSGHRYVNHPQRVWLAAGDTFYPLTDELTSHLDPVSRHDLAEMIDRLAD
jgi:hypothetical protein